MAKFNVDSGERKQVEIVEPDATNSAIPKVGDQLQELMNMLAELQLLNLKKESNKLDLRCIEMSKNKNEGQETGQNQHLSFLIEPPAIVPEILNEEREIAVRKKVDEERVSSRKAQLKKDELPSEEELEKICRIRGFEIMRDEIDPSTGLPHELSHDDYVEAARRCLAIEEEMYVFFF